MTGSEGQSKECQHCELPRQRRKLHDKHRSDRGGDGEKGLREADGEDFVCHVHSPLVESI